MSKKPEWAEALDRLLSQRMEVVPPGWKTAHEIAKELGICFEMAKLRARDMVKAGLAERRDFRVRWGKGVRPTPYYRLISKKR